MVPREIFENYVFEIARNALKLYNLAPCQCWKPSSLEEKNSFSIFEIASLSSPESDPLLPA